MTRLLVITALVLATYSVTPAKAVELEDLQTGATTMLLYEQKCGPLPGDYGNMFREIFNSMSEREKAHAKVRIALASAQLGGPPLGPQFCAALKPQVEKLKD